MVSGVIVVPAHDNSDLDIAPLPVAWRGGGVYDLPGNQVYPPTPILCPGACGGGGVAVTHHIPGALDRLWHPLPHLGLGGGGGVRCGKERTFTKPKLGTSLPCDLYNPWGGFFYLPPPGCKG